MPRWDASRNLTISRKQNGQERKKEKGEGEKEKGMAGRREVRT